MQLLVVLASASFILQWTPSVEGNKTKIVIGVLVPFPSSDITIGYTTAIRMAFNIARNRSEFQSLFKDYDIEFKEQITNRHRVTALSRVLQMFQFNNTPTNEKPLMFLGPAFSETAIPVAALAKMFTFMQVSFAASSDKLTQSNNFLNTGPSVSAFNNATIALMNRFGWRRAALLYDFRNQDGYFTEKTDKLVENFQNAGLSLIGIEAIDVSPYTTKNSPATVLRKKLKKLKEDGSKIFIGEFGLEAAWLVFCEVYHLKLYGPGFVWILHYIVRDFNDWGSAKTLSTVNCTREQLLQVLNYAFVINKMDVRRDVNTITSSGMTVNDYFDTLNRTLATKYPKYTGIKWNASTLAFDAMWMTSIALNNTRRKLSYQNMSLVPNDTDSRIMIINILRKSLNDVNFQGLSGPVTFNKNREREGTVLIEQFRDGSTTSGPVGQYFLKIDQLDFFNYSDESLFQDNKIPSDRSENVVVLLNISSVSFTAFSTAASFGIVIGVVFLVFNRYYRSYKFIRLSAPMFNDIIVLGCILCLITVFMFGIRVVDEPKKVFAILCKVRAWTLTIGFSLAFGAMFIKTWRIYKIFTNKQLKARIALSNWHLLAMIAGIVAIDIVILVTWEMLDSLKLETIKVSVEKASADRPNVVITNKLNTCSAEHYGIWLSIIYVYKGVLLLYGVFLSYETRNVVYAHLNDSRVIGICVYNVVVLSAIGAFLDMVLDHMNFRELYASVSVCIIFPSTATICLIFIPKLIYRLKTSNLDAAEMMPDTTMVRPSIDLTSTCYQAPPPETKQLEIPPTAATNAACSQENDYEYISPPGITPQGKVD